MARKFYEPITETDSRSSTPNSQLTGNIESQLAIQSRELYANFLREEIELQRLNIPADVPLLGETLHFSDPLWLYNATSLRQIANEFANSPLRNQVRIRAQGVDLLTLNSQNFSEMIQEIFSGGTMTQERILVVFFFCSDVALFALQSQTLNIFRLLIQWSTDFITERMANWIHEQGGWGSVLNNSMNGLLKISATIACALAAVTMLIFIRKNWNS